MNTNKKIVVLSQICLTIFLPIIILFAIVQFYAFNHDFYMKEFNKYNITEVTGMNENDLSKAATKLIDYLKDESDNLNIEAEIKGKTEEVFGEREKKHMVDVKVLFEKGYRLRFIGILVSLSSLALILTLSKNRKKDIFKALLWSAIIPLILMVILFILIQIDFYKYFTHFHEIFFTNDLWLLNPKTDVLIQMLPLEFFIDITKGILGWYVGILITILIISYINLKNTAKIK